MTVATTTVPSDKQLQCSVQDELRWEPSIDAAEIAVAVNGGVVTLTGVVKSFFEKWEAESAAKRVHGVMALANEIEVRLPGDGRVTDTDIARAAAEALAWNSLVPRFQVKVSVSDGRVVLEGEMDWRYQKLAAESAVRHLNGVRELANEIVVKPRVTPTDIKARIEAALSRSATLDAQRIRVETEGSVVKLRGDVRSWAERDEADRSAWAAPGVSYVENYITVAPHFL